MATSNFQGISNQFLTQGNTQSGLGGTGGGSSTSQAH